MLSEKQGRGVDPELIQHSFQSLYGLFWLLSWQLSTVTMLEGVSFRMLMNFSVMMMLKVSWKSNLPQSWLVSTQGRARVMILQYL